MMHLDPYTRLHVWLRRRRRAVLWLVGVFAVGCGVVASRIRLDHDILAILPHQDRAVDDGQYAMRKFRQIDRMYIEIGVSGNAPEVLDAACEATVDALTGHPAIAAVVGRDPSVDEAGGLDWFVGALPNLFTDKDAALLAFRLGPGPVREYLAGMIARLGEPAGLVLKDLIAADPIGLAGLIGSRLGILGGGIGQGTMASGRILAGDGRHALIAVEPRFPATFSAESEALVRWMLELGRSVERRFAGVDVLVTGGHRMAVENASLLRADAARCTTAGVVAMAFLCLLAYRRRWTVGLTFLPSLFGGVVAVAALGLSRDPVSAMALGFASIGIGITVDYAIDIVYHLEECSENDPVAVGRHLRTLVVPIAVGALTSVAAFVVMGISPLRAYRQIGAFGTVGVLVSAAFTLLILPMLMPSSNARRLPTLPLTAMAEGFERWRSRHRAPLLAGVGLVSALAVLGLPRLRFEGDLERLNGISDGTRRAEASIRSRWGDALGMTLVVARGRTLEEALARNDAFTAGLAGRPGVRSIQSVAGILPSEATQTANRRRWRAFWTEARRDALRETLGAVSAELGFRPGAFAPFWKRLGAEPRPIALADLAASPFGALLREKVAIAAGDVAVATLVRLDDRRRADRLRDVLPGAMVVDKLALTGHIGDLAKEAMGQLFFWSALLVGVILYFCLGSIAMTLVTLIPLICGLLWTLGGMAWLGMPVDLVNGIFVVFVMGIAEDYSLLLVADRLNGWRGYPRRSATITAAIAISSLTTIIGCGALVLARHPALWSMGTTVFVGIVLSVLASLVLTPLLAEALLFADPPRGPRLVSDLVRMRALGRRRADTGRSGSADVRRHIERLYAYQGKRIEQYAHWKLVADPMFAPLDRIVPGRGLIVDLGCGFGLVSHWLAETGPERALVGIDRDADKIRVARRSAPAHARVRFECADIVAWHPVPCDAVLLLDVLHYWPAPTRARILSVAREALRPGGTLVVREAARASTGAHRRVEFWERFAVRIGHNKSAEGLHFLSLPEILDALRTAGFSDPEAVAGGGRASNVLVAARVPGAPLDSRHACEVGS